MPYFYHGGHLTKDLYGGAVAWSGERFLPSDIAGLQRWYQLPTGTIATATDGTGAVADGGLVAYWEDLSTNTDHAIQATVGDRLTYRTGHAVLGGCLESVSSDYLIWPTPITLNNFTCVWDVSADSFLSSIVLSGSSASNFNYVGFLGDASNTCLSIFGNMGGTNITIVLSAALLPATRYIVTLIRSGSAVTVYVNNIAAGSTVDSHAWVNINQILCRGAKTTTFDGAIRAILLYNVALNEEQRGNVYSFLAV